jgi:hypothetical protein
MYNIYALSLKEYFVLFTIFMHRSFKIFYFTELGGINKLAIKKVKHYAMMTYGRVEILIKVFFTLILLGSERSVARSD